LRGVLSRMLLKNGALVESGFSGITWEKGVRSIQKVDIVECGPVVFQANDEAKITAVRATDFNVTQSDRDLVKKRWELIRSLEETFEDIFWGGNYIADDIISMVDTAIIDFHTAYMNWITEYYDQFENREGQPPREIRNKIQFVLEQLGDRADALSQTPLTADEYDTMAKGKILPIESRSKLKGCPKELRNAHKEERRKKVESLCDELRTGGFSDFEKRRLKMLIGEDQKTGNNESITGLIDFLKEYRAKNKTEKGD